MAKRPTRPTDETPPEARTDSNVTRIPVARRRKAVPGLGEAPPAETPPPEAPFPQTPLPTGSADGAAAPPPISDDDLTADALRHALDRGEGGDKVDFIDPAAAPLGTDDEAGGNPPTREQIIAAARQELGPPRSPHDKRVRRTIPLRAKDGMGLGLVLVLVLLVVLMLALW